MITIKEATERLKLFDLGITADDFKKDCTVTITHEDGSFMQFTFAFYMKEDKWLYVFTEHNGSHLFHIEDLRFYKYHDGSVETKEKEAEAFKLWLMKYRVRLGLDKL